MQIQLNNQFEQSGLGSYYIDKVIPMSSMHIKDVEMQDCSKMKKISSGISEHTVSTNHMSNVDVSSGEGGSADRIAEPTSNYSSIMYERWQRSNIISIPQLDQKDIFE
jgi:hypothetical protein